MVNKYSFFLFLFCYLFILNTSAQSSYIPLNGYSFHVLDRMEIKQGRLATPQEFSTSTRVYKRENIAQFADSLDQTGLNLSEQDLFNLAYLQTDNFEYSNATHTRIKKPIGRTSIYEHKAAFFDVNQQDFKLILNPVSYLQMGYDQALGDYSYINNRGVEIRGKIGKNIAFYTQYSDENQKLQTWNQAFYNQTQVVPGMSFLKTSDKRTFNYWQASGYAVLQAGKYFDIQLGHGRNFFGNGYRTLLMSDFSKDHLFMRVNTRIWKIHYTNIWGQMYDYVGQKATKPTKRHYYATTHASINLTKKLNLGLFQTISFQRDSGYANTGYDPQYLNPIIFYKPIENGLNSPDKAILGLDAKYNFAKHFSAYGQFVISELVLSKLLSQDGWVNNKFAYQLGLKYIDVFNIQNLDLQLEYNQARPYMYTSFDTRNAYVNYNQNMAHPLGANFREFIEIIQFQPLPKMTIRWMTTLALYGNDTNQSNWGKDIRLSYTTAPNTYGNEIGQGIRTQLLTTDICVSYMLWHNVFIDLQGAFRKTKSDLPQFESSTFWGGLALRINIAPRYCSY